MTSDAIISKMSEVFAENGSPNQVVSDNGGHYSSQAFRNFAAEWCFDHVTSSPHFRQSNGFIERQVQTVKYTLKKAAMSRSNPQNRQPLTLTGRDAKCPQVQVKPPRDHQK